MAQAVATLFDLDDAVFARCAPQTAEPAVEPTVARLHALTLEDRASAGEESGLTCSTCGAGSALAFASLEAQRAHFRGDWHRFNLKRRLAGLGPIPDERFEAMLGEGSGEELGSISGSASDDDSSAGESDAQRGGPAGPSGRLDATCRYFTFRDAETATLYGVWKTILPGPMTAGVTQQWAALSSLRARGATWAVLMLSGGHFATAVLRVDPRRVADRTVVEKFEVLAHGSAHRYVVRAKAGGRQSTKDATGKYARSAGSRLRRYNEAALAEEVRTTLAGCSAQLAACDVIFVHAPGSNWRRLVGNPDLAAVLPPADPRIR